MKARRILGLALALLVAVALLPKAAPAADAGDAPYTVEFTYDDLQYVLQGGSEVALSKILATIGLVGEPTDVEVSDPALFSASKESSGWVVSSHQAFSSEEWMHVTIAGQRYEIAVTDEQIDSGTCGEGVTWTLDDSGTLTISGEGAMYNYGNNNRAPWLDATVSITTVNIEDGLTWIGDYAFFGCTLLKGISIPSSVTWIGLGAFKGCTGLESAVIPSNVTSIGMMAFQNCTGLTSVDIPSSVEVIGDNAFHGCSNLEDIYYNGTQQQWDSVTKGSDLFPSNPNLAVHNTCTVSVNPTAGGTVSVSPDQTAPACPDGKYWSDTAITLTATADDGYRFVNWIEKIAEGDKVVSTDAQCTYEVTGDHVLIANFKRAITITAASDQWAYDGTEHSNETVTVTSGSLADGDRLVATATGKVTNVGDTSEGNNEIDEGYKVMHGAEDVTGNYIITPVAGTLTITKVLLTVTAKDQSFPYNGQKQGPGDIVYEDDSKVIVEGLKGDDKLTAVTVDGQGDVVNTYDLTPSDAAIGEDGALNGNYEFSYVNGTLTIEPVSVTATTGSASKVYDGKALTNAEASITGLVNGETATVKATGSQTEVGSSANTYSIEWGSTKKENYTVTEDLGTLTVEEAPAEECTVTFANWDGAVLQSGKVAKGEVPEYTGKEPTRPETAQYLYVFQGWNHEVVAVDGDATYTAVYEPVTRLYSVTWLDDDGTEFYRDVDVPYGATPKYEGATPTKPSDEKYAYAFAGWTPEVVAVDGDATYTAKYAETPKPEYKVASGAGGTWAEGSDAPLAFKVERTVDPKAAFAHFKGVEVDGKAVPEKDASGKANWTARSGSVVVELQPSYLSTLSAGRHTLAALFDDGGPATAEFTVKAAEKAAEKSQAKQASTSALPKTSDPSVSAPALALIVVAGVALAAAGHALRRREG